MPGDLQFDLMHLREPSFPGQKERRRIRMGYRLSKIYTRTGDLGTTGLGDGSRVSKNDPRVDCTGDIDELNSQLGVLLSLELSSELRSVLVDIQHDLFDLGGELSVPGHKLIEQEQVEKLEGMLDRFNEQLEPLANFILPGGVPAAAACHVARAVCRRAERKFVTLMEQQTVNPEGLKYLNRLSDLLFVAARIINRDAGAPDVLWQQDPDLRE